MEKIKNILILVFLNCIVFQYQVNSYVIQNIWKVFRKFLANLNESVDMKYTLVP